jgi:hypothetical protein
MEFSFFSFSIDNENVEIRLTPIEFFNVEYTLRYVCMYRMSMIDKKDPLKTQESIIPYYISNGQTNRLRANMIYPFMCYSDWTNQGVCPFFEDNAHKTQFKNRDALLLKYTIGPNFNFTKLENQVIDNFIEKDGIESEDKRRKMYQVLETHSNSLSRGLPSVLPRLRNFMDFVLCILNENIIHFNPAANNLKCFRPLQDTDDKDYIDMKKCVGQPEILTVEDDYRFVLFTILNRFANLIIDHHFIDEIQLVRLKATPISKEDFNIYAKACNKDYIIKNTTSYGVISQEFRNLFKNRIATVAVHTKKSDMTQEESDIIFLDSILSSFRIRNPFFIYSDHLTIFNYKLDCSKPKEDEDEEMGGLSRMD